MRLYKTQYEWSIDREQIIQIIFLIVINRGSAKEGLADASAPPRKTKALPLHP